MQTALRLRPQRLGGYLRHAYSTFDKLGHGCLGFLRVTRLAHIQLVFLAESGLTVWMINNIACKIIKPCRWIKYVSILQAITSYNVTQD